MRPTSARAQSARTLLQLGRPPSSSSSPEVGARAGVLTQDPPRREQLPREPSIPMARFRGASCCATTDVRGRPPLLGRLLLHSPPGAVSGTKWVWYGKHGTGRAALPIGCSQRRDYADEVGGHACSHFFGRIAVVVAASAAQLVWCKSSWQTHVRHSMMQDRAHGGTPEQAPSRHYVHHCAASLPR